MTLYSQILVINLMHIGDLLLVTPALRTLRHNYPRAHIALLADAKLADLVKYNRHIDELIAVDKKGYHNKPGTYLQMVGDVRRRRFDLVVNLHANERASFIAAFSGAKKIVGYSTFGLHWLFDGVMKNRKAVKHQVESHFDVLRELAGVGTIDDNGIEMWLDDAAEAEALRLWHQSYGDNPAPVIGLNVGASWPTKRWRHEYYAQLADQLLGRGYGIAFFGGSMDEDIVAETLALMSRREHPRLKVFTGQLSLLVLAAMLKQCRLLVTNDSGPMHIAVAMDVPLVTMFGSSPVPGFYPYTYRATLIKTPVDCHPCGDHHCDTHECMKVITVDIVMKHTLEMLAALDDPGGIPLLTPDRHLCRIVEL
ncbi:MAG TPA: glycosyltransferase family 9 protein [Patescibacteria group bacterium]|nr:glycosyltransferase family 9 protein [Patescibacteria group bacterium]